MSRRPYYPWRRPRIFSAESEQAPKNLSEIGSLSSIACPLCDAHVPCFEIGDLCFLQMPSRLICEAPSPEVCPLLRYMATGAAEKRADSLPSDSDGSEVHSS
jgi:hypothetical protein